MENSIKPVQIDVGQQRRKHPSLRSATLVATDLLSALLIFFHHRRPEPLPDKFEHTPINHSHPYASHQLVVRNGVEVPFEIRVINLTLPCSEIFPDLFQCLGFQSSSLLPDAGFFSLEDLGHFPLFSFRGFHTPVHFRYGSLFCSPEASNDQSPARLLWLLHV
jgi:hypothetical protein